MVSVKSLRSVVGVGQLVALVTGLALLCPCPARMPPSDAGAEHHCCSSEGFRAATSCCLTTTPASQTSGLAQFAPAPLVPLLADAPVPLVSVAVPVVMRPVRLAAPPPLILRI